MARADGVSSGELDALKLQRKAAPNHVLAKDLPEEFRFTRLGLCDELNATESLFPGTELKFIYTSLALLNSMKSDDQGSSRRVALLNFNCFQRTRMAPIVLRVDSFNEWRGMARSHLLLNSPPSHLIWQSSADEQQFLFQTDPPPQPPSPGRTIKLPRLFLEYAKMAGRHRDPNRWALLYRIGWRIQNENANLLYIETDDDVRSMALLRKAVENDIHDMQAFVRFRRVVHEGLERYVAWYRPDHYILDANASFFTDRFGSMRWAILTPEASMTWDLTEIRYGPGVPRSAAPAEDEFEDLWRAYYASTYNPARLNPDVMLAQLPVRRWQDLPESRMIPELIRSSPARVESMIEASGAAASAFIPPAADLQVLRKSIRSCDACELCRLATQAVFGETIGHPETTANIDIVMVGEQPGDEEDRAGRPFIGPAGQVLHAAIHESGLDQSSVFVTNAVKAFRFEERGKRRIHKTPRSAHISICRPWLEAEIAAIHPRLIVCLGATAAQSVLGRTVRISEARQDPEQHRWGAQVIVTYHPSAILRAPDEAIRADLNRALIEDLKVVAAIAARPPG